MKARFKTYVTTFSLVMAVCFTLGLIGKAAIAADKFPDKPVQRVVPFGTGGGSDRTMRLFAPYLSKELGVPVNVINIKGGGGWVAWAQMAKWTANKNA